MIPVQHVLLLVAWALFALLINGFFDGFNWQQYQWVRRILGGTWHYQSNWITEPFWSRKIMRGCGSKIERTEIYK